MRKGIGTAGDAQKVRRMALQDNVGRALEDVFLPPASHSDFGGRYEGLDAELGTHPALKPRGRV